MASPVLESFCCMHMLHNDSCDSERHVNDKDWDMVISYNLLCIMSSSMSICGASYQLLPRLPRRPPRAQPELESMLRQNAIICCLAIADLLASIGVLVRSALWMSGHLPLSEIQTDTALVKFARIFCAVCSAWVQFFYVCTYFWTLIYAVDIYRLMLKKRCMMLLYHGVCWGVSAVICAIGLAFLYTPSLLHCIHDYSHLIPHFLSSYIPMCLVMVANPILYSRTTLAVRQCFYNTAVYTEHERAIVRAASGRFRAITVVFYVCWLPNVVNGVLLLIRHFVPLPAELTHTVWHVIAVLNPLQAFLNSIVYRGVGLCYRQLMVTTDVSDRRRLADESSPLLHPLDRSLTS